MAFEHRPLLRVNPFTLACIEQEKSEYKLRERANSNFNFGKYRADEDDFGLVQNSVLARAIDAQELALNELGHDLRLYPLDVLMRKPKFTSKLDKDMAKAFKFRGTLLEWKTMWVERHGHQVCEAVFRPTETRFSLQDPSGTKKTKIDGFEVTEGERQEMIGACKLAVTASLISANVCIASKAREGRIEA